MAKCEIFSGIDGPLQGEIEATGIMLETMENKTSEYNGGGIYWEYLLTQINTVAEAKPKNVQEVAGGIRHIREKMLKELLICNADNHYLKSQRIRMAKAAATSLQARLSAYQVGSPAGERDMVIGILGDVVYAIKTNKTRSQF